MGLRHRPREWDMAGETVAQLNHDNLVLAAEWTQFGHLHKFTRQP